MSLIQIPRIYSPADINPVFNTKGNHQLSITPTGDPENTLVVSLDTDVISQLESLLVRREGSSYLDFNVSTAGSCGGVEVEMGFLHTAQMPGSVYCHHPEAGWLSLDAGRLTGVLGSLLEGPKPWVKPPEPFDIFQTLHDALEDVGCEVEQENGMVLVTDPYMGSWEFSIPVPHIDRD